jgi:hypothetical protein
MNNVRKEASLHSMKCTKCSEGQQCCAYQAFIEGAMWVHEQILWIISNQEGVSHWTDTDTVELIKQKLSEKVSERK